MIKLYSFEYSESVHEGHMVSVFCINSVQSYYFKDSYSYTWSHK